MGVCTKFSVCRKLGFTGAFSIRNNHQLHSHHWNLCHQLLSFENNLVGIQNQRLIL